MSNGVGHYLRQFVWPIETDVYAGLGNVLEKHVIYKGKYSFRTKMLKSLFTSEKCTELSEYTELDRFLRAIREMQPDGHDVDLRTMRVIETLSYSDECTILVSIRPPNLSGIQSIRCIFRYSGLTSSELDIWIEDLSCSIVTRRVRQKDESRDIAYLTHDIRNALAAILYDLQKTDLIEMKRNLRSHVSYVSDLCEFYSVGGNSAPDSSYVSELFQELEAVASNYASRSGRHIQISTKNDTGSKNIGGNFLLIRRVLDNLISNAFKYSGDRSMIDVKISICETRSMRGEFHISVTDEGIGIKKQNLEHIFERGFREIRSSSKGMGYGLSLLKEYIEKENGSISVDSTEGIGSTFHVMIPVVLFDTVAEEKVVSLAEKVRKSTPKIKGNVIIADDEDDNIRYFSSMFNESCPDSLPIECYCWDEVLEEFSNSEEGEYAAIFSDMNMDEGIDARTAVQRIRHLKRKDAELPVVLVTGDNKPDWTDEMKNVLFLGKPYSDKDLARMLMRIQELTDE